MSSPLVTATVQSTLLSITSNVLAQIIQAYNKSVPLSFDYRPTLQFAIFSILSTPLNFIWQQFLEKWFPSKVLLKKQKEEGEKEKSSTTFVFSKTNALKKFLTDNFIGGPINTLIFMTAFGLFRGHFGAGLFEYIKTGYLPMQLAGMKLWPAVSVLTFTVIPPERRVVFGSLVALGWNVYLGLIVGNK